MTDGLALRVLIVEDHIALAENLGEFLSNKRYILDFAADGLTGLHLAATNEYDVIVLDVMLPGIDGFELCRRLRHDLKSAVPIIMLTAKDAIEDKEAGFSGGADDYLTKPFNMKELELRIMALSRRSVASVEGLRAADLQYFPGTLQLRADGGASTTLSGIGATLIEVLMRAYPNYVKHQTLMEQVWEDDVDPHTLRSHIYALRKSLKGSFGRSLIRSVHGKGYCFTAEAESENGTREKA
ncbi:response regulator transcription factor [Spongiibacter marinus]|uniref:response regulator transcription factor n=1 Tax=Spongiibacter marinus TaxID=354246 RepID=UPI003C5D92A1